MAATTKKITSYHAIVLLLMVLGHQDLEPVRGEEVVKSIGSRAEDIFGTLKRASRQGASFVGDLLVSIPFGKIALGGGALLGIFFLFLRLIIVMGPILILGALTRESTDATDLLKMLIDFYNQIIVSLDEQMIPPAQAESA